VGRREGVSDDYDGGRLRKWSREDVFETMKMARSSAVNSIRFCTWMKFE